MVTKFFKYLVKLSSVNSVKEVIASEGFSVGGLGFNLVGEDGSGFSVFIIIYVYL